MSKYKFNWDGKGMHWTVVCPTCRNSVPITIKRYQAIKSGMEGLACVDEGNEHWVVFTKEGIDVARKEGLQSLEETSCSTPGVKVKEVCDGNG